MHVIAADRLQVADVVVHVDAIDDVVRLARHRLVDVPLDDLTVEEERRVRITAIVEGRVQRSEAHLGLRDDLERVGVDDRDRRRQLPGGDRVAAVGRHVDAVGVLRHGNQREHTRVLFRIENRHAVAHFPAPGGDGFLGRRNVDGRDRVAVVLNHRSQVLALLEVVDRRERVAAVLRRVGDVDVAVDAHLELHLHAVGIDERDHGRVGRRIRHEAVGRLLELAVDDDVLRVRGDHGDAVRPLHVRQLEDAVGFEVIEPDPRQPPVGEVVDPEVLPIGHAVGFRKDGMVGIAPHAAGRDELLAAGIVVVHGVAVRRPRLEHRDLTDQTARRNPDHEHRSALAARQKGVVLVELSRRDVHLFRGERPRRARRAAAHRVRQGERGDHGRGNEDEWMTFHMRLHSPAACPEFGRGEAGHYRRSQSTISTPFIFGCSSVVLHCVAQ